MATVHLYVPTDGCIILYIYIYCCMKWPGEIGPGHKHDKTITKNDVLLEQVHAPAGEFLVALPV